MRSGTRPINLLQSKGTQVQKPNRKKQSRPKPRNLNKAFKTCEVGCVNARYRMVTALTSPSSKAQVLSEGVPLLTRGKAYEVSSRLFADA